MKKVIQLIVIFFFFLVVSLALINSDTGLFISDTNSELYAGKVPVPLPSPKK